MPRNCKEKNKDKIYTVVGNELWNLNNGGGEKLTNIGLF